MIIRRRHTANFTTIGNALFDDERLEADEVGVLGFLLSRPNDWEVRRPQLQRRFRVGRDSIKRILFNCIRYGWMTGCKTRLSNGTFHTIYEVRDQPGPTLSAEDVKAALSLVSSEPPDIDANDGEPGDHLPDSGPPPTPQPEAADQLRQTRRGSSKEELLNTDSINPDSPNQVCGFADVLQTWPPEHVLSSVTSEAAYASLTKSLKIDCFEGLKPYLSDCKAQNRKVCDLTTFIRERRWERFVKGGTVTAKAEPAIPYSPRWWRWREYYLAEGKSISFMETQAKMGKPWSVPSEWPPPISAQAKSDNVA